MDILVLELGLPVGPPAVLIEEVHCLDREFHSPFVPDSFSHLLLAACLDIRHSCSAAYIIDLVRCFLELVTLDQGFCPLKLYIGIADKREVGVASLAVDEFAFEESDIFPVVVISGGTLVQPEVPVIRTLLVKRPTEFLTDHILIVVVVLGVAVHRFIRSNNRLFQTWVSVVIGCPYPVLVPFIEIISVEDILSAHADCLCLLGCKGGIGVEAVTAEEYCPLFLCQTVPSFYPLFFSPLGPTERSSVYILIVVHEICGRFDLAPSSVSVTTSYRLLDIVSESGCLVILDGENHLIVLFVCGREEVDVTFGGAVIPQIVSAF